jgi:hypothetical protein
MKATCQRVHSARPPTSAPQVWRSRIPRMPSKLPHIHCDREATAAPQRMRRQRQSQARLGGASFERRGRRCHPVDSHHPLVGPCTTPDPASRPKCRASSAAPGTCVYQPFAGRRGDCWPAPGHAGTTLQSQHCERKCWLFTSDSSLCTDGPTMWLWRPPFRSAVDAASC